MHFGNCCISARKAYTSIRKFSKENLTVKVSGVIVDAHLIPMKFRTEGRQPLKIFLMQLPWCLAVLCIRIIEPFIYITNHSFLHVIIPSQPFPYPCKKLSIVLCILLGLLHKGVVFHMTEYGIPLRPIPVGNIAEVIGVIFFLGDKDLRFDVTVQAERFVKVGLPVRFGKGGHPGEPAEYAVGMFCAVKGIPFPEPVVFGVDCVPRIELPCPNSTAKPVIFVFAYQLPACIYPQNCSVLKIEPAPYITAAKYLTAGTGFIDVLCQNGYPIPYEHIAVRIPCINAVQNLYRTSGMLDVFGSKGQFFQLVQFMG
ncbi:anhydro-N-acetylmuramic acid kinase [Treponema medium]|nr:anhydro-N-acetylmuramic acid kinase [Treponema medium]